MCLPIVTKIICCAVQELNIQYYINKLYFIIHYSEGWEEPTKGAAAAADNDEDSTQKQCITHVCHNHYCYQGRWMDRTCLLLLHKQHSTGQTTWLYSSCP